MRRLLGYVVKLPDGTRSPLTPTPVMLDDAGDAWDRTPSSTGDYVCPVFSVRRPKSAPAVAAERPVHRDLGTAMSEAYARHYESIAQTDLNSAREDARRAWAEVRRMRGEHDAAVETARREAVEAFAKSIRTRVAGAE